MERRELEEHVGHFIVTWGFVDFILSMTVSAWAGPGRGQRLQHALFGQRLSPKVEMLEALLPEDWRDGKTLIFHLKEGNAYRNTIAHHTLAMGGQDGDKSYGWHFWKIVGTKRKHLEVDPRSIVEQNLKADILREAVGALMQEQFVAEGADLNSKSLADAICNTPGQWDTRADFDAFRAKTRSMFPG
jgi:hypothetical protein